MKLSKSLLTSTSTHLLVFTASLGILQAQQVDVPEIKHNALGCSIDWMSKDGRSYFLQYSSDMENWQFMPLIRSGDGSMLSTGFQCNSPEFFLRLNWTDLPDGGDPNTADFDSDGIGSLEELQASPQTSPLLSDTDGDGLLDSFEIEHGFNPASQFSFGGVVPDGSLDSDLDGVNTLDEQNQGGDPNDPEDGGSSALLKFETRWGGYYVLDFCNREDEILNDNNLGCAESGNSDLGKIVYALDNSNEDAARVDGSNYHFAEEFFHRFLKISSLGPQPSPSDVKSLVEGVKNLEGSWTESNSAPILRSQGSYYDATRFSEFHEEETDEGLVSGWTLNTSSYTTAGIRLTRPTALPEEVSRSYLKVGEINGEDIAEVVELTIPKGKKQSEEYVLEVPLQQGVENYARLLEIEIAPDVLAHITRQKSFDLHK